MQSCNAYDGHSVRLDQVHKCKTCPCLATFMNTARRSPFRTLVQRCNQTARWLFFLAAIPLVLLTLIGVEYGGSTLWAVLTLVCLFQTVYPTLLGWGIVFLVFLAGVVAYAYTLGADLLRVVRGEQPWVFLGPSDTTVFLMLFGILVVVVVGLVFARPKPHQGN